ncbi:hypothetical protein Bca101_060777 [Brassica carinata]
MEKQPQALRLCGLICIALYSILHLVEAQDQKGFISLDCGLSPNQPPYNDPLTGLTYSTDDGFVQSGKTGKIQKEFEEIFNKPSLKLRYFPDGVRNCYTVNVTEGTNYLIKAVFVYGNYDGLDNYPSFDLYLGPNLWSTVDMKGRTNGTIEEIIHRTISKSLQVCLVKTGTSNPFINTLELRPLKNNTYNTQSGSLKYFFRYYFSTSDRTIRYPNDVSDRKWYPFFDPKEWTEVTTDLNINNSNGYAPPQIVMASASTPISTFWPWNFTWSLPSSTTQFYVYLHFAEIQTLKSLDTREFKVTMNGKLAYERYSPRMLATETIFFSTPQQCEGGKCILELTKTPKSTLPPLVNALELFTVIDFPQLETNQDDVVAIKDIQNTYGLTRITWNGDPCVPKQFLWDGLNCNSLDISTPPTITSLNLSSSQLTGIIAPGINDLIHLQELDLSHNNLTGGIPEFLAGMKSLSVINLSGNNLNGTVPQAILQKKGLNLEGNPFLICPDGLCVNKTGNGGSKKTNVVVPAVASVVFLVVLGSALAFFLVFKKKKTSIIEGPSSYTEVSDDRTTRSSEPAIMTKNKRFTYSEVVTMTNNFERVLGKGGFGMVYHGTVNGTEQVAVKMLSHTSSQGYKEFKAEVELLLRVHHKNLVGLVGYCDEGENLALIYEYMANGDLREHMSGKRGGSILNWETRLKIVVESAQEIITNQPVINQSREKPHIAEWVGLMLTKGDIKNIVDPNLYGDYDSGSVWRAVELAMSCLNPSSARRPTMSQVVIEINECLAYENSRGGTSHNMNSQSSREVSMNFDIGITPGPR